jgi:hypothetical protein
VFFHQLGKNSIVGAQYSWFLLDLSAAFDTISHDRLLSILSTSFGLGDSPLDLIKSYLLNRSFMVKINNTLSSSHDCSVGVPQGSVLGPVLFNCIMALLPSKLAEIGIDCHIYADDTQFWVSFRPEDESIARRRIKLAFKIISRFMITNGLKLNADKTSFLPISRRNTPSTFAPLELDDTTSVGPSDEVRNLGVIFDGQLNLNKHISSIRQSYFVQLKRVRYPIVSTKSAY